MIMTARIRLKPTKEQEILFYKSAGAARWAYNYFLRQNSLHYQKYSNNEVGTKYLKENEVRKYINNVLKPTTHAWLKEVGSNVVKQAVKDADDAMKRYFSGVSERPKFKSKKRSKLSFYVNYESLKKVNHGFRGEKIGVVKTCEQLPKLRKGEKYSNPRITYDNGYWYLSVGYNYSPVKEKLSSKTLGIDIGIKELAYCSDGKKYKNINKTKRVKELKKKLKREQRKLSRKIDNNISSYTSNKKPVYKTPLKNMKNIQKQKKHISKLYKKLNDIRKDYTHQVTSNIVKSKPCKIVIETLNIKGMMKNRHLAKSLQEQNLYEFQRQLTYKGEKFGIQIVHADRWYPSSKTCSCCGSIKKDLKLKDRVYKCEYCGLVIDRDYNASINLANYKI